MKHARVLLGLGLLLGLGCFGDDGVVAPNRPVGKVTLLIADAPEQITRVVATLSRQGFSDLTISLTIADSTQSASGSFADVPVGRWHLLVEAMDALNVARFRGASEVDVFGVQTSEVDLELLPTSGSIWNRSLDLDGSAPGGIAQSFATQPGTLYLVRFQMAGNPDPSPPLKTLRVQAAGRHADFTFDTTGRTVQDMGWVAHNWSFTADSTTTTVEFRSLDPDPNGGRGPALDNVVINVAHSGSPILFSDDFDGTALDSSKWILASGNGTVTVSNGKATLSCPAGGIFPYMVPRGNPIPAQGDFVVRVGMRYVSVASAGTGFKGTREDLDPSNEIAFANWQDTCCGGHRALVGSSLITLSQAVDTHDHTYEWRSIQGTYSFYFDGQLMGSGSNAVHPTSFFFGHPPVISLPAWSSHELDYVRVERSSTTLP